MRSGVKPPELLSLARSLALGLVVVTVAIGCGGKKPTVARIPKPPEPTMLHLDIIAEPDVNPDSHGRASAIQVRVYELRSAGTFDSAGFLEMLNNDSAALGAEMLAREDYVLRPGDQRTLTRVAAPEARLVGAWGGYQVLDRTRWRASAPLEPNQTNRLTLRFGRKEVSIGKSR